MLAEKSKPLNSAEAMLYLAEHEDKAGEMGRINVQVEKSLLFNWEFRSVRLDVSIYFCSAM